MNLRNTELRTAHFTDIVCVSIAGAVNTSQFNLFGTFCRLIHWLDFLQEFLDTNKNNEEIFTYSSKKSSYIRNPSLYHCLANSRKNSHTIRTVINKDVSKPDGSYLNLTKSSLKSTVLRTGHSTTFSYLSLERSCYTQITCGRNLGPCFLSYEVGLGGHKFTTFLITKKTDIFTFGNRVSSQSSPRTNFTQTYKRKLLFYTKEIS